MIKHQLAEVDYIESGTFQGGEEEVSNAGIKYGESCVVLKKQYYKRLLGFYLYHNPESKQ